MTPDVILASGGQSVEALQRVSRSMPIIFANVIDPVGEGFITSLPRPGGNTTGFLALSTASPESGSIYLESLRQQ